MSLYTGPKVGVGVFAMDEDCRVVMAERFSDPGRGTWCLPGGKIDKGQTIQFAGELELFQETGLTLYCPQIIGALDEIMPGEDEEWMTVYMAGFVKDVRALERREPDKHGEWDWYDLDALPEKTWSTITRFLRSDQGYMFKRNWIGLMGMDKMHSMKEEGRPR